MASRVTTTLLRNGLLAVAARDGAEPDSILIEDGRIRWIGRSSDAPSTDRVIDLQGSRVVSGLTDAHAHLSVANSAALALAGFDVNTPDPQGGTIERANGRLTGVLTENAADVVAALMPSPSRTRTIAAIRKVADECLRYGIVAVVEAA